SRPLPRPRRQRPPSPTRRSSDLSAFLPSRVRAATTSASATCASGTNSLVPDSVKPPALALAAVVIPAASQRALGRRRDHDGGQRSEEHTSELQSHDHLVCRPLLA